MISWIRSSLFAVCLVGAVLAPLSEADAALSAYLKLEGDSQGTIKGGATKKGLEGRIEVDGLTHEILAPYHATSGLATGKRQHNPLTITKAIDKSTPLLASLLTNVENIPKWELAIYAPNKKGVEVLTYTIRLTNAKVSSIRWVTDADGNVEEVVSFTYKKIEWVWAAGGISAQDDWGK